MVHVKRVIWNHKHTSQMENCCRTPPYAAVRPPYGPDVYWVVGGMIGICSTTSLLAQLRLVTELGPCEHWALPFSRNDFRRHLQFLRSSLSKCGKYIPHCFRKSEPDLQSHPLVTRWPPNAMLLNARVALRGWSWWTPPSRSAAAASSATAISYRGARGDWHVQSAKKCVISTTENIF